MCSLNQSCFGVILFSAKSCLIVIFLFISLSLSLSLSLCFYISFSLLFWHLSFTLFLSSNSLMFPSLSFHPFNIYPSLISKLLSAFNFFLFYCLFPRQFQNEISVIIRKFLKHPKNGNHTDQLPTAYLFGITIDRNKNYEMWTKSNEDKLLSWPCCLAPFTYIVWQEGYFHPFTVGILSPLNFIIMLLILFVLE